MATNSALEIRVGAPDNVLEVQVGALQVDVPRSIGFYGSLAAAAGLGLIEPPLALFIAGVPLYTMLTHTALPRAVRAVGEVLEGAARPVPRDVMKVADRCESDTLVYALPARGRRQAAEVTR